VARDGHVKSHKKKLSISVINTRGKKKIKYRLYITVLGNTQVRLQLY